MKLVQITKQGLASITVLVALLWGCVVAERLISRNTRVETYRALRAIRYLKFKRYVQPTSEPKPFSVPSSTGTAVG